MLKFCYNTGRYNHLPTWSPKYATLGKLAVGIASLIAEHALGAKPVKGGQVGWSGDTKEQASIGGQSVAHCVLSNFMERHLRGGTGCAN